MVKRKPFLIMLFSLLLILLSFVGCPQTNVEFPKNWFNIYVCYNGEPITRGLVFGNYGQTEEELSEQRKYKSCIEISWTTADGKEIEYETNNSIFTDTFTTSSSDYATFNVHRLANETSWDLYGKETVLRLTYNPVEGEKRIIDNIPTNWFDKAITGECQRFVADFGELTFKERNQ